MSRPLCFSLIKGLVALISLIYRKVLFPNKVSPTPTICNNHSPVWKNPHPFWQLKIHCIFLDLLNEKDQASATTHEFKRVFWMCKRTISLRWFFWVPTTYCGWEVRKILFQYMLIWRPASMFKLLSRVRAYSFDGVWKKFLKWMFNKGKYM